MSGKQLFLYISSVVLALAIGSLYGGRLTGWFHPGQAGVSQFLSAAAEGGTSPGSAGNPTPSEPAGARVISYWYDAMNPQHHYSKPGKAPDGMDLVPMYADIPADHPPAGTEGRRILYWYDPMHPQYRADKPGKAPDCGMDLVPKYADSNENNLAPGTVTISADKQQLIGVRTAGVGRESLAREIHTSGQIAADENRIGHVHVKVNGFIEKVYVGAVGQLIRKGQPLFTLYSPDLVATQQEYLLAKRGESKLGSSPFAEVSQGADSLLNSTRQRLQLWDITEEQIRRLDESGEITRALTFYSPVAGFVTDRKAFPQTAVTPETELYTVSDLSTVWINADIYEYEAPFIKVGQPAEMRLSYYPGKVWKGRISYVYPTVDPVTRTLKGRMEFANPGFVLKPQMFADVQLKVDYGNPLVVPQEAVLDSGREQSVFVAHDGGKFEPRKIAIGAKVDGKVVVLSGLKTGETIVTSGNFLVDSESRLKSAMK